MYTRKDAHEPASRSTTPKRTAQTGSTGARSRSVAPAPQPELTAEERARRAAAARKRAAARRKAKERQ